MHLVTGGMPIGGRMPRGVRIVQLPPIRVSDASFMPLRDADYVPIDDAYRESRRDLLLATYDAVAPDAVIFETFPFGRRSLRFELMPLLERIDATRPRPLVIGSVRDILQMQPKVEREREMLGWAKTWFDAILVHGDPRFARFEETFPLLHELGPPVHYTGFVLAPGDRLAIGEGGERKEVVVSAGGGAVGIEHLALALAAQPKSRFGHLTWRVLAGPNIPDDGLQRLLRAAGPRPSSNGLARRFSGAAAGGVHLGVAGRIQHGARRRHERRAARRRSLHRQRRDRAARARRAAARVRPGGRGGRSDALRRRCSPPPSTRRARASAGARWNFDSDGATRSAAIVADLIAERARDAA